MKTRRYGPAPYKRIYLITPKDPDGFWTMRSTLDAVGAKSLMPSNTLATLVALTPPDVGVEYLYCDENTQSIDFRADVDLVALTGFTLHSKGLASISSAFRARGIPVALGGAYATLMTEDASQIADHLFVGEGEYTWPQFLRDLKAGKPKGRYVQKTKANLHDSPPPDWSFIDAKDYLYMTVQASRGCPNKCDFCDAVQLVGRRYRTKHVDQVMLEIENAQQAGAETIFFSEDNFFVKPSVTRELLKRIIAWNTALPHPVQFSCQASMRLTDDEDIMRLMADARFAAVFVGLESVREACLVEVNKGQLFRDKLVERMKTLSSYGMLPFIGLIVGFDHDDENSFEEIERFLIDSGSPFASLSVLNAPEGTPLHNRLSGQGRIDENFTGKWHFSSNIKPLQWPLRHLLERHRELFQRLYAPEHFGPRAIKWLQNVSYHTDLYTRKRRPWANMTKIAKILKHYALNVPSPVRAQFFHILLETLKTDPRLLRKAITIGLQYCHYYDFATRD